MNTTRSIMVLTFGCLLLLGTAAQAQVYKTVDKDGNVVYTDKPPTPGAEPMNLPALSVVPVPESQARASRASKRHTDEEGNVTDFNALRRGYRDFRIVQPLPEQSFNGTNNIATIAWETEYALQQGMSVIISINGQAMEPTTQQVIASERLDRGEHQVSATLVDARNRTVATAEPVTFFVRQWSQNFGRPPGVGPAGGGG